MLIGQYLDYRDYLKDQLGLRAQANPQYSLRAFARDIEVGPQFLSHVLNGKKNISSDVAVKIARRLRLSNEELSYFYDLVELSQAKSEELKEVLRYRLAKYEENKSYREIHEDVFKIISDWHHNAILELTFVKNFKNDAVWMAKKLGISPIEVRAAVDRLLRLELLELHQGTLRKTDVNLTTSYDVPSAALKKLTKQFLSKAAEALEEQDVQDRDFGTITMAINPEKIPEAKKMIKKFRRDLCEHLETGSRQKVYTLSTQLFEITNHKEIK